MWLRPTKISTNRRNATGRNATYPSRKRTTGRDQRAVVMRCTATNAIAACEIEAKKSQLTCRACHARGSPRNTPNTKMSVPITARMAHRIFTPLPIGRDVAARISALVRACVT